VLFSARGNALWDFDGAGDKDFDIRQVHQNPKEEKNPSGFFIFRKVIGT
jgi:hypothetical protein